MCLQDALEFVRNADSSEWNPLIAEMNATRKRRDLEAARRLNVGDSAVFEASNPSESLEGRIIKVSRTRVTLAVPSKETGFIERISVPAGMVRRVS